ncbi:hypothetical protein C2G38_2188426 [Gigaspora rosea]|uniref:Uncharacterized protein n=1 Tax=Gigaspora rosea TaxID=44941 RepID=A0A397VAM4_9GLOM|nr:hypothetical protein C2G38_2188426 [Gigaspora rosea]
MDTLPIDTLPILNVYENLFELNNTEFNNTECSVTEFNNTEYCNTEFNEFNNLQDHANAMYQYYEKNSYCTQNMDTLPILDVNENFFELDNTVFDNLQNHANIMGYQHSLSNNFSYNSENSFCAQLKENTQTVNTLPILDIEENFFNLNDTEFNNLQDHPNIIVQQQLPFNDFSCLKNKEKDRETTEDIEAQENDNRMYIYSITLEMDFANWADLDRWLDNHGKEYGFAFTITHSEKDKEDGIPRRRKYRRMKERPYVTHKEAHTTKERN